MARSQQQDTNAEESFFRQLGVPLMGIAAVRNAIELNRDTGNVVCIVGDAGIGKTHITQQVAAARKPRKPFTWRGKEYTTSVPLIALYLAHLQPEDLSVPYPSAAKQDALVARAAHLRGLADYMRTLGPSQPGSKINGVDIAAILDKQVQEIAQNLSTMDDRSKRNGTMEFLINKELFDLPPECILFWDELNRGEKGTVKSFFTLMEDGTIHGVRVIHPGVQMVGAINPSGFSYSVNEAEKDPAIKRRLCFVAMTVNVGTWIQYAEGKFHPLVVDFIKSDNGALYDTKLRLAGKVYPCPATWEKVSKLLVAAESANVPFTSDGVEACVCGHVGETVGSHFLAWVKDKNIVINPDEVLHKYMEKSRVRDKVKAVVESGKHDVLSNLCSNVATTLLASKPDPAAIAPKLALFLGDLPSDSATAFIVHKLRAAAQGVSDASTYLTTLSKALSAQVPYQKHIRAITEALQKARQEAGKSDPI